MSGTLIELISLGNGAFLLVMILKKAAALGG